jgi:hypothetical protein
MRRTTIIVLALTVMGGLATAASAGPIGYGDCVGISDVTVGTGGAHIGEAYADPGSCI